MRIRIRNILVCLAVLCLHSLALAQVPAATAEVLMRKSGVWDQLADIADQVKASISQSPSNAGLEPQDIKRLEQVAGEAFDAQRLREDFLRVLSSQITAAPCAQALKWYGSPTGAKITALEISSSTRFDDMNSALTEGNRILAQSSAKRQSLLSQTVKATGAAQALVTMQINSTLAILQGVAHVAPQGAAPQVEALRRQMEAQRPQMEAASMGIMLSTFALTYQTVNDKALQHYIGFLSSKSGVALTAAMMDALDKSLSAAARRLGSGIPQADGTTTL